MRHWARCAGITFVFLFLVAAGICRAQEKKPKAALGIGWTYLYADQGANERESINGWYVRPSLNLGKGWSVFADFTNYYGTNHKGSLNSHGFTFGAGKSFFSKAKVQPTVFAEAGDVRASSAGEIVNQFAFATGFSLQVPVMKHFALTATPAEWVFLYPKGDPRNDYNAKAGFSISF